jgi:hypothetical protein
MMSMMRRRYNPPAPRVRCPGAGAARSGAGTPWRTPSMFLHSSPVTCPYCWEQVDIEVDESALPASYVEDCSVCCRPMVIDAQVAADGHIAATARREND